MNEFDKFRNEFADKIVEEAIQGINKRVDNEKLTESMNYSLTAGGKRIRPILMLATAQTFGVTNINNLLELSSSIELIHTYSLIHDDLPEMDNDDLRRGKLTSHKKFGTGQAVLAGDALLTMAFEFISDNLQISDEKKVKLISILSKNAGAAGMISGQLIDISNENNKLSIKELKNLHNQKTGALLAAAIEMGLVLGEASEINRVSMLSFAKKIGLAFQVKDDILDVISDTKTLGKKTQKDNNHGKNTFPALLGLDESINYLKELVSLAQVDLSKISVDTRLFEDFLKYFDLGE